MEEKFKRYAEFKAKIEKDMIEEREKERLRIKKREEQIRRIVKKVVNGKELYKAFLDEFGYIGKDFKILVPASDVKKFLKRHGQTITFEEFNKLVYCEGRSTGNKYVYDYIKFKIVTMKKVKKGREKDYPSESIKTLNYYGSKKRWQKEYELIYKYAQSLGCDVMVDAFGGSGFLALLASKTGGFERIILNELSDEVYNYHFVQKDEKEFDKFLRYITGMSDVDKDLFQELREYIKVEDKERKHIRKPNATKAAALFIVNHYAHSGQGGYVKDRKAPNIHKEALEKAQELYANIELKHYHYRKLVSEYMHRKKTLTVLDPPYLAKTRVQKKSYRKEYNREEEHKNFLKLLTKYKLKGSIVVCGYHSELYEEAFQRCNAKHGANWHEVKLLRPGRAGQEAKERIWVNFDISSLVNDHQDMFEFVW